MCRKYDLIIAKENLATKKSGEVDDEGSTISLIVDKGKAKLTIGADIINRDLSIVANNEVDLKNTLKAVKEKYGFDELEEPGSYLGEPKEWDYFLGCLYFLITQLKDKCTVVNVKKALETLEKEPEEIQKAESNQHLLLLS